MPTTLQIQYIYFLIIMEILVIYSANPVGLFQKYVESTILTG
jgi:hypothetical protein